MGQGPMMGQSMYLNRIAKTQGIDDEISIQRFGREAKRCLEMLDDQLKASGGPFLFGKDVSQWLTTLHERESFKTGLSIPFRRPAFFGPPWATEEEIQAEIAANSAQFTIKK